MTDRCHAEVSQGTNRSPHGTDGAVEPLLRFGPKPSAAPAIFIHAGAGFHSHLNEHVHLEACVAAAEMGIKFLKAGSTAAQAVEAALRTLEDREITNAGYGSNLSIRGTVECDATMVDHLGRSGACGAVPNVRNPISLAKLILDLSNQPLSLRRVSPNALVGRGAKEFAEEHGLATFPDDYLVSKNARERFLRWQEDLRRAESNNKTQRTKEDCPVPSGSGYEAFAYCDADTTASHDHRRNSPPEHSAAPRAGTWNEGQPHSPSAGTPSCDLSATPLDSNTHGHFHGMASAGGHDRSSLRSAPEGANVGGGTSLSNARARASATPNARSSGKRGGKGIKTWGRFHGLASEDASSASRDGSISPRRDHSKSAAPRSGSSGTTDVVGTGPGLKRPPEEPPGGSGLVEKAAKRKFRLGTDYEDGITDTVGAIAIDHQGHIAAGSSSGGIGMKHEGRLGPAALVGVGTAVVPCAEDDEDGLTVASVTSGTGEHMATTMAAQRCAERIYRGSVRGPGGVEVPEDDENAIMESFIVDDFMNHPGVKNCHSAGAIGIMIVKKSRDGYYLYFAHNTDSFALASIGAGEREALCTMSRLSEGAHIAKGGRKIRIG